MYGAHCTKMAVCHVERCLKLLQASTDQPCRRLVAIVQQANLVKLVQFTSLRRDVGRREMQTAIKISGLFVVDQLGNHLPIPRLVELVDHDAMESRHLSDNAYSNFQA